MPNSLRKAIGFIEPMYALGVTKLPEESDWLYEVKLDGYRCLAGKDANGVTLWSRRGNVLTSQFPTIAKACEHLPAGTLVDGEVVAMDLNGRISFNILQHHRSQASATRFYVFDILLGAGRKMLNEPLLKRRDSLTRALRLVRKASSVVELSQTVTAPAAELIRAVRELGLEGIIAKRHDSAYEPGSAPAHGSNTRSTKARNLSSAAIRQAIRSTRSSSAITREESFFSPARCATALFHTSGAK